MINNNKMDVSMWESDKRWYLPWKSLSYWLLSLEKEMNPWLTLRFHQMTANYQRENIKSRCKLRLTSLRTRMTYFIAFIESNNNWIYCLIITNITDQCQSIDRLYQVQTNHHHTNKIINYNIFITIVPDFVCLELPFMSGLINFLKLFIIVL